MFTKCVHFLLTASVSDNSTEIATVVVTELGKGCNACTKILTTFILSKGSVILTGTAKFSHGINWHSSSWIWLSMSVEKQASNKIQLCAFAQALAFFLLKYYSGLALASPRAYVLRCALSTSSNIQVCSACFEAGLGNGMQVKFFQPPDASAQLKEYWVLRATVTVMLMTLTVISVQGIFN